MPQYQEKPRRAEIVQTKPVKWIEPSTGKVFTAGTKIKDSEGNVKVLLTPAGKTAKAAEELRRGERLTNELKPKTNKVGNPQKLSKAQRAYRAGRLDQAKDSAKCWKANGKRCSNCK